MARNTNTVGGRMRNAEKDVEEFAVDFMLWARKTHPTVLIGLMEAYKKSKEMKK